MPKDPGPLFFAEDAAEKAIQQNGVRWFTMIGYAVVGIILAGCGYGAWWFEVRTPAPVAPASPALLVGVGTSVGDTDAGP